MRGGVILIIAGILLAYLGATGKYACFTKFLKCAAGQDDCGCGGTSTMGTGGGTAGNIGSNLRVTPLRALPSLV